MTVLRTLCLFSSRLVVRARGSSVGFSLLVPRVLASTLSARGMILVHPRVPLFVMLANDVRIAVFLGIFRCNGYVILFHFKYMKNITLQRSFVDLSMNIRANCEQGFAHCFIASYAGTVP